MTTTQHEVHLHGKVIKCSKGDHGKTWVLRVETPTGEIVRIVILDEE